MRHNNRQPHQNREIKIIRNYTKHAAGSVMIKFGDTHVLCCASISNNVPKFLKGKNQGWVTAEYGMLPSATVERTTREARIGHPSGRTYEIQRLIGRSLRSMVDLKAMGENTITIDCDVIQADGGTRCAAITGGCVALIDALNKLKQTGAISKAVPIKHFIAAVSVGIINGTPMLDLDYSEDSTAETDMNVVMTSDQDFIEVQGTAEGAPFKADELSAMLELAKTGIADIINLQKAALEAN